MIKFVNDNCITDTSKLHEILIKKGHEQFATQKKGVQTKIVEGKSSSQLSRG